MRNYILFLFFFLCMTYSFSQEKSNVKCGFFGNKSVDQRKGTFPFNESKKILLISYPNSEIFEDISLENGEVITARDSITFSKSGFKIEKEYLFQINDTVPITVYDATKIVELNQIEIDEFSNWLINYDYEVIKKNKPVSISLANCNTPRNAVVFLNNDNKVISILEICFECGHYYLLPDPNKFGRTLGIDCDEKLDYFKSLFEKKGFTLKER